MDTTFEWFSTADLSAYRDKYISIVNSQVICADEDPEVAYAAAKQQHPDEEIVLWKVPEDDVFVFGVTR